MTRPLQSVPAILRAHGMSLSDLHGIKRSSVVIEDYHDLGYNYRLSDLHAAVGIEQMKKLDLMLTRRQRVAQRYNEALSDARVRTATLFF